MRSVYSAPFRRYSRAGGAGAGAELGEAMRTFRRLDRGTTRAAARGRDARRARSRLDPGSADPPRSAARSGRARKRLGLTWLEKGAERLGLEQLPRRDGRRGRARAPRRCAGLRASTRPRPAARAPRAARAAPRNASGVSKSRRTTSCGATVPFQWFSLSRQATSKRPSARSRSSCDPWPKAIALPASRPCWRTRNRRCFPSPTVAGATACSRGNEQRHVRVAEPEGREPLELLREPEREVAAGDDGVDGGDGDEILPPRAPRRRARRTPRRTPRGSPGRSTARPLRGGRRSARGAPAQAARAPCRSKLPIERPEPFQPSPEPANEDDGTMEPLDEPRGDDADDALVPVLAPEDVAAAPAARLGGSASTSATASRRMRSSTAWRSRFSSSSSAASSFASSASSVRISSSAMSGRHEPAGGVDARREAEADRRDGVDRRRVDMRAPHERLQPGPPRATRAPGGRPSRERGSRRRSGTTSATVASATRSSWRRTAGLVGAEERLAELVHDAGPAELRERIVRGSRGDDRAVGQRRARPVVVGHDHLEPEGLRLRDLVDGGDPAVDRQHEPDALVGEPAEGVARDAVALLEAARKMPDDVRAELAQEQHRERRRADAVDVVVAVDADPLALVDRRANAFDGDLHVTEEDGVVPRHLGVEEAALPSRDRRSRGGRGRRPSPRCSRELPRERVGSRGVERVDSPDARHANDGTDEVGRPLSRGQRPARARAQRSSRRRRSESSTTFTQSRTMPTVAPRTTTAIGV